ncbi:MAG: hypothetical protein WD077_13085 [Bacteroidia bacterium]
MEEIIDKSYEIFKKYKATAPLDACTECCLTKNQESELVSLSVRHIPFDLLYDYNTAAKTEKPDIQEFKHFLPRFLELTKELKFLHHDEELVFSRFDYYDKDEWSNDELDVLKEFANAFFQYCLTVYSLPELARIDGILVMLHKIKIDIHILLAEWTINSTPESVLHFNDLINWGFKDNKPDELSSPFASTELSRIITEWLENETTKERFSEHIEQFIINPPAEIEDRILTQVSWTYERMKIKSAPQHRL